MNDTASHTTDPAAFRFDAWLPPEMAERAEEIGVKKAYQNCANMMALAILAGAFVSLGAVFSTAVAAGTNDALPYGLTRLLSGLAFCLGLILVVVAGAELFTGNNLKSIAWASGKISTARLLKSWAIVYLGNFIGALATAAIMIFAGQYAFGNGAVGGVALAIADAKCGYGFIQAFALGVMANALVCLAVWLCFSARTTADKILSIIFPITAFVACGFEHSIANMYFIPFGLLLKAAASLPTLSSWGIGAGPEFWAMIGKTAGEFKNLTWGNFFAANLLPVTLGNIFGGSFMVGLIYWFIYVRNKSGARRRSK